MPGFTTKQDLQLANIKCLLSDQFQLLKRNNLALPAENAQKVATLHSVLESEWVNFLKGARDYLLTVPKKVESWEKTVASLSQRVETLEKNPINPERYTSQLEATRANLSLAKSRYKFWLDEPAAKLAAFKAKLQHFEDHCVHLIKEVRTHFASEHDLQSVFDYLTTLVAAMCRTFKSCIQSPAEIVLDRVASAIKVTRAESIFEVPEVRSIEAISLNIR